MRFIIGILLLLINTQCLGQNISALKQRLIVLKERPDSIRPKYFDTHEKKFMNEYYRVYDSIGQTVKQLLQYSEFAPKKFFEKEKFDDLFTVKGVKDSSLTAVGYSYNSFGQMVNHKGFLQYKQNGSVVNIVSLGSLLFENIGVSEIYLLNKNLYLLTGGEANGHDLYNYSRPIRITNGKFEVAKNLFPTSPDSFPKQRVDYNKSDSVEKITFISYDQSRVEISTRGLLCVNCYDNFTFNSKTKSFVFNKKEKQPDLFKTDFILRFNGERFVTGK